MQAVERNPPLRCVQPPLLQIYKPGASVIRSFLDLASALVCRRIESLLLTGSCDGAFDPNYLIFFPGADDDAIIRC
jgi:hypothetical protein